MTAEESPLGFPGFVGRHSRLVAVPDEFFLRLLPRLDHLGELKLLLHVFWMLTNRQAELRFVTEEELLAEPTLLRSLRVGQSKSGPELLREAIERAVDRNVLMRMTVQSENSAKVRYYLNSPAGRHAMANIRVAALPASDALASPAQRDASTSAAEAAPESPTVFSVYEQNIALLTPLVADAIRAAMGRYPEAWLHDAIREAAERNRRSWRYVQHLLERWEAEGRSDATPQRGPWSPNAAERYSRGPYGRLVQS